MPLDPECQMLLDQMQGTIRPFDEMSVEEARASIAALTGAFGEPEAVAEVENRTVPGPRGEIPVRVYTPEGKAPFPVLVYLHGGGWVIGSLDTHDGVCRTLANAARCVVVSVDYRLAPEHPQPASAEDSYAAVRWVAEHAASIGADPNRVAVGGDSAGGNLSAVVSQMARDRGGPRLVFQLLVYPVTDTPSPTYASYTENGEGYFLTTKTMHWFWNHYCGTSTSIDDPYLCPIRAKDLTGLPPALVVTAEYDPLRDEGEAYAAKLREAGVPTELKRYPGMIHGFFGMGALLGVARQATADAAAALRSAFARR
ncbi:MAG TPA: alpha/beta hydrolase [Candidatus Binatia bacterium]|nr:alpha/beta hydrolase [Candidatus Binatia bacterium]